MQKHDAENERQKLDTAKLNYDETITELSEINRIPNLTTNNRRRRDRSAVSTPVDLV